MFFRNEQILPMVQFIFILTILSVFCLNIQTLDPELNVDTRDWVDPNDPFDVAQIKLKRNCQCDCGEELENYKNAIYQQDVHIKEIESKLLKKHENFTKLLLSDIFHGVDIDIFIDEYVFKRGDITISRSGMDIVRRFFKEAEPNDVLKASLQLEMKSFLSEVAEPRENPILVYLRGLAPYLVGGNIIILLFVIFHYGIFRNRRMMLLVLFCGFYVAEVSRVVNMRYKEALAKRMAQDSRKTENPCYPKGYFSTVVESVSSVFVRTEDECYKFYRDSMVDVELDVRILGSAFSVLGETLGSFFVGLFRAIREAVEDYFSPAPIYVQIIKMFIFIVLIITVIILTLKFCEFEIQNPLMRVRWRIGQGVGYRERRQSSVSYYEDRHRIESISPRRSRSLVNRSRSFSRSRIEEISTAEIFLDAETSEIKNADLPVLNSPNITPRSEARKKNMNPDSEK